MTAVEDVPELRPARATGPATQPPRDPLDEPADQTTGRTGRRWSRRPGSHIVVWTAAIAATVLLQWRWLTLYDDVRGSFGALRVGEAGGLPPVVIFIHRPMANRILMSGLDHLTFGSVGFRERLTLAVVMVVAGVAGAGLARSLRHWVADLPATLVGLAVFAALAWAPDNTLLQPEWTGVLICVPALTLALRGGPTRVPRWHSPLMWGAGLLLATATLQKYVTATSALLALGIVLALSRRRALIVGSWTFVSMAGLFGLTVLEPDEWLWFQEMPRLQPATGMQWLALGTSIWRVFWANPILLLWPAASVYTFAVSRRRVWLFGPLLAVLLTLVGVVLQGRFYPYHYGALPVLLAALAALAAASWWQQTRRTPYAVVLVAAVWLPVAAWMGDHADGWRVHHSTVAIVGVVGTTVLTGLLAYWQVRLAHGPAAPRPRAWNLMVTAAALALIISFPDWPHTPNAFDWLNTTRASELTGRTAMVAEGAQIRAAAGGAPVAYVTKQEGPYFVGLPATCSYPMAVFLYRSVGAHAGDLASFRENLDCLRDPTAKFLVLEPYAAARGHALPIVRTTIDHEFDCQHPVSHNSSYVLCPRR